MKKAQVQRHLLTPKGQLLKNEIRIQIHHSSQYFIILVYHIHLDRYMIDKNILIKTDRHKHTYNFFYQATPIQILK